ncbi:MAG: extensin family protein [Phreatobacter sp.]|uniref:extensin-like domain-containing protein n=1 Tax=Phreatobacter sp. TaxID=1966341 RepID=UPI002736780F|nr:extensin family protein [Phreatobacter sp.]MDP2800939.1 extensin family protein [Phreatobacter sp.]
MVARIARLLVVPLILAILVTGALVAAGRIVLPPRWDPFAPFDIVETPSFLTRFKFARARDDGDLCRAALTRGGIAFEPVPDRVTGEGCGFTDAVRTPTVGATRLASPVIVTCRVALSLAMLDRHALGAAARRHLGTPVTRIEHLGTYACRNINHAASGRRSRHATADAIDISGFQLADGRRLTLTADWSSADPGRAAFLRAVRDAACVWFDVTLSPDHNPLHYDHFHFDVGGGRACR